MTITNQTSMRSKDELRILAPWAYWFFTLTFLTTSVLMVFVIGLDHKAPSLPVRCLMGVLMGAVFGCYVVLIGYVNQDAGQRGMSRLLWTLIAIIVPNGLGIVLYFVLRKPRVAHCPQCESLVEPGFAFCPRCRARLQPVCPHCKRSVNSDDKFCPYCGGALEAATATAGKQVVSS